MVAYIKYLSLGLIFSSQWLRPDVRDEVLLKHGARRLFVRIYYKIAPPIALWLCKKLRNLTCPTIPSIDGLGIKFA